MRCSFAQALNPPTLYPMWTAPPASTRSEPPLVCIRAIGHDGDHELVDEAVDAYFVVRYVPQAAAVQTTMGIE